jgi:hypothetical protein
MEDKALRTLTIFTSAALWILASSVAPAGAQSYYPNCPQWSHSVTFTNNSSSSVQIIETDGCYNNNMASPYTGKCWPQQIQGGTLTLAPNASQTVSIISCWSGNFSVSCPTCNSAIPYQTLAEFTFDGGLSNTNPPVKINNNNDSYDVSLVNGFTTALMITPGPTSCSVAGCSQQPACPEKLAYKGGCLSPNTYVNSVMSNPTEGEKDKYGCICSSTESLSCGSGNSVPAGCVGKYGCSPFSSPGSTHPGSACCPWYIAVRSHSGQPACSATTPARAWASWAQQYIANVHAACPNQYAWQFDDKAGSFSCPSSTAATSYTVTVPAVSSSAGKRR